MHADAARKKRAKRDLGAAREREREKERDKKIALKCSQDFDIGGVWVVGRTGLKGAL